MVIYTGQNGILKVNSVPVAAGAFSIEFDRSVAAFARSGKYSDYNLPGKLSCTGTIDRMLVDGALMGMVLATPTAGSVSTLHAGIDPPTDGTNTITTMTSEDSTSDLIKLTALTKAVTATGRVELYGTDVNGTQQVEIIDIYEMSINDVIISTKIFKTLEYVVAVDYAQVGGTLKVESITATASVTTLGAAEYFTLEGSCSNGDSHITISLTNCFFTKAGLIVGNNDILVENLPFVVKDFDTGTSLTWLSEAPTDNY